MFLLFLSSNMLLSMEKHAYTHVPTLFVKLFSLSFSFLMQILTINSLNHPMNENFLIILENSRWLTMTSSFPESIIWIRWCAFCLHVCFQFSINWFINMFHLYICHICDTQNYWRDNIVSINWAWNWSVSFSDWK